MPSTKSGAATRPQALPPAISDRAIPLQLEGLRIKSTWFRIRMLLLTRVTLMTLTVFKTYLLTNVSDLALNARKASNWALGTLSANAVQLTADWASLLLAMAKLANVWQHRQPPLRPSKMATVRDLVGNAITINYEKLLIHGNSLSFNWVRKLSLIHIEYMQKLNKVLTAWWYIWHNIFITRISRNKCDG